MSDFEKDHPLMNEITRTINELYVHKKEDELLQALLKHEGLSGVADKTHYRKRKAP